MAIKTLHLTNAFHTHSGGIATFYQAMLQVANQQGREMRLIVPAAESHVEQVGDYGRIYFDHHTAVSEHAAISLCTPIRGSHSESHRWKRWHPDCLWQGQIAVGLLRLPTNPMPGWLSPKPLRLPLWSGRH